MNLITWNTQWCLGVDGQCSPTRIIEQARDMADFDVLCLQEIAIDCPGLQGAGDMDQVARLRALLPGFDLHFGAACIERGPHGRLQQFGNLIATRVPVLQVQHHPLPWPADPLTPSMPRMCTSVTLAHATGPLRVMTTHLEYASVMQRGAQVEALCGLQRQQDRQARCITPGGADGTPFQAKPQTSRTILCGDFNMAPGETAYRRMLDERDDRGVPLWQDAWHVVQGQTTHTPTFRLFDKTYGPEPVCCDFVFVTPEVAPHLREVAVDLQTRASDHQPVLATFDL